MAKSRKKKLPPAEAPVKVPAAAPSLEDDAAALTGWWVLGRVSKLLWISGYSLHVYRLGADRGSTAWADFDLEERDGARVLVELRGEKLEERVPLFAYSLRGDWLGLEELPGADFTDYPTREIWELEGAWFRLKFPEEAGPHAPADR